MPQWNIHGTAQVLGLGLMFRCIAVCFVVAVVVVFFPWKGWGSMEAAVRDAGIWVQTWRKRRAVNLQEQSSSFDPHSFLFLTLKVLLVKICHYARGSSAVDVVGSVPPQKLWSHIEVVFCIICKVHLYESTDTEAQLLTEPNGMNKFQGRVCSRAFQSAVVAKGSTERGWTCKGMQSTSRTWLQVPKSLGHSQLPAPSCHRAGDTTRTQTWAGRVSLQWVSHRWVLSSFVTVFTVMRVFGP